MFEKPDRALSWRVVALMAVALAAGCQGTAPAGPPHTIIYQSEQGGAVDVWIMDGDGSRPTNLSGNGALDYNDRHPTGSSDGSRIAFRSDRDGNPDVFIMNADGTEQMNLTTHPAIDIDPSFSPDGSRITFDSDRDGNVEIYVMKWTARIRSVSPRTMLSTATLSGHRRATGSPSTRIETTQIARPWTSTPWTSTAETSLASRTIRPTIATRPGRRTVRGSPSTPIETVAPKSIRFAPTAPTRCA